MILQRDIGQFLVNGDDPVEKALRQISANKHRVVFVVTSEGQLVGSLTDGDFRRWLVATPSAALTEPCATIARRECHSFSEVALSSASQEVFGAGVDVVPVLDARGRVVAVAQLRGMDFSIEGRRIAEDQPVFVIAEIGLNHNGSLDAARRLVDAAALAGADCAKFQLRDMASLYRNASQSLNAEDLGAQYTMDLLAEVSLTVDETLRALEYTREAGLVPLCTPWDLSSAETLKSFGVPAFKVASADLTNHPLIRFLGATGTPLIVSTGMADDQEIRQAVAVLQGTLSPFTLLQCNSSYPAPFKDINLRQMARLKALGECHVGYSGHERGQHVVLGAVALGARVIEKHLTLDRAGRGNDHRVSLEPEPFAQMISNMRDLEEALGQDGPRTVSQGEALNRLSLAKSLVASRALDVGDVVRLDDVDVRSPGRGLQPNMIDRLVGTTVRRAIPSGEFFYLTDIDASPVEPRDYSFNRPWGLPVRFHDWQELTNASNPDFLEFHLSYRDLDAHLDDFLPDSLPYGLVVHSPDLFEDDLILDLASDDTRVRQRSVEGLARVVDLTKAMASRFQTDGPVPIVASLGGSTLAEAVASSERKAMYDRVIESLRSLDLEGVRLLAQTLPPFPWYLGGQRHCNLFVDAVETAQFSTASGVGICLDLAHTKLACNAAKSSFHEALATLLPHTAHLHIVDAAGLDGEGLQVLEGEIDWDDAAHQIELLAPNVSFIPEIWQGHVDGGRGFWVALERLETILRPR